MGARNEDSAVPNETAESRLGTTIAERYVLEKVLGVGGAGVLYRARHARTGRAVAVKLLHGAGGDAHVAHRRLEREAIAAVELEHPHVVDVLDFGEDPSGAPYLIMELLHGHSLQEELDRDRTLSPQRMFDLLVPILGALAVAHDHGVLHRDVKPANLFVVEHTGGTVIAKLLDFGIALVEGAAALTQPGRVVGTLGFMSPEQVHGETLAPASDLWLLAAVMFRCLTGKLPREETSTLSATGKTEPASAASQDAQPLLLVISRALENDPRARFEDARSFARALLAAAHYAGLRLPESPDPMGLPDWPRWRAQVTLESSTMATDDPAQTGRGKLAAQTASTQPREGTVLLERFLLKRPLGSGAMGVVYEAEHLLIQRPCAIKLLHPSLAADPALRQRFKHEAQRAGRILHEHVVSVTDYDVDGDTPFLVMELLRGESLRELLDRTGALPYARAAQIGVQIARGLAAAHELGVIHRDLKPQNVFVTRRADGSDLIKILDFGVAKALQGEQSGLDTQAGQLLGTVRYMSPEQLRSPKDVDARADVYAAGLIVYEMLAGRPGFDANDVHATIHQLLYERPPALNTLRPGMPATLVRTVEQAMQPAADARFGSATELAEALQSWTTEGAFAPTTVAVPVLAPENTQLPTRRGAGVAIAAGLSLLLIAALVAWLLHAPSAPSAAPQAEVAPPSALPPSPPVAVTPTAVPVTPTPAPAAASATPQPPAPSQNAARSAPATTPPRRVPAPAARKRKALDFDDRNPYE